MSNLQIATPCPHRKHRVHVIKAGLIDCSQPTIYAYFCARFGEPVTLADQPQDIQEVLLQHPRLAGFTGRCCDRCDMFVDQPETAEIRRQRFPGDKKNGQSKSGCGRTSPKQILYQRPVDLLLVGGSHWRHRLNRFSEVIATSDIKFAVSSGETVDEVSAAIARRRPAVVLVHTFHFPAADVGRLAEQYPDTTFCNVCHSSLNHLFGSTSNEHLRALALTERFDNCWYATPERDSGLSQLGYPRAVEFPNPMPLPASVVPAAIDPPTVLIAGRADIIKAHPAAIAAAGILARRQSIRVLVATRNGSNGQLQPFFDAAKIAPERLPWTDYETFAETLRTRVSIVLQPSLSESFNYLALEAMSAGRPVIGSPAIRFLPAAWQADPNHPEQIADLAVAVLAEYDSQSQWARRTAAAVCTAQNAAFFRLLKRLGIGRVGNAHQNCSNAWELVGWAMPTKTAHQIESLFRWAMPTLQEFWTREVKPRANHRT